MEGGVETRHLGQVRTETVDGTNGRDRRRIVQRGQVRQSVQTLVNGGV